MNVIKADQAMIDTLKSKIELQVNIINKTKETSKFYYTLRAYDHEKFYRFRSQGKRAYGFINVYDMGIAEAYGIDSREFFSYLKNELGFKYNSSVGHYVDSEEELLSKFDSIYRYIIKNRSVSKC